MKTLGTLSGGFIFGASSLLRELYNRGGASATSTVAMRIYSALGPLSFLDQKFLATC